MIKRYRIAVSYERRELFEIEKPDGNMVKLDGCMIAEQEDMMIGDPLDGLNEQIQKQVGEDNGPFDVMIIMKRKGE